jgi:hypothetical protein
MDSTTSEGINFFDDSAKPKSTQSQNSTLVQCSGKGCRNLAKNLLMISFVKKTGYFCDECAHDLLNEQLATRVP